MSRQDGLLEGAAFLRDRVSCEPRVGLVLGSGLGQIADLIEDAVAVPYADVPHLRASTALGHAGRFVCGLLSGVPVICMQGRLHPYEGYTAEEVVYPIRLMRQLGAERLLTTNASGGINTSYRVGDLVLISDHINLMGGNPLTGRVGETGGIVTPDMSKAYPEHLRAVAREVARGQGVTLREGVYIGVLGPSFETPAEIRAFRTLGADLVGMSTVYEVIAAVEMGMEVLGISLVTNMAAGVLDQPISGEEVMQVGARRAALLTSLICNIVAEL
ncbi:MAG: purine-nucleoside phosphorylase [Coriobacteriales bacterium]|nr:purine-nucleoside phosphorylase [Coriobacteriales bacterium]MDO4851550.1 purine-nucleoside phosphorylase [Actinomycetota bacterium]